MNRFANIWLLIIAIGSFPFAVALGTNEDFSIFGWRIEGQEFEHGNIIFSVLSGLVFLLGVFKASRRWSAIRVLSQKKKFQFITPIRRERQSRLVLYTVLELVFISIFALFFLRAAEASVFLGLAYAIIGFEHLLHLIIGISGKLFAVGITKKAVVAVDREARVMYLSGLLKVSKHQQSLYFEYVKDLVLHMPLNMLSDEDEFIIELKKVAPPEKVFYSGFEEQKL